VAIDPGLANDTCTFIEAIKGDRGVHNANKVWWLSPDITVAGTSTPSGFVESGPVRVKIRRKPASSNCQFLGDENVTVQLWAAPPSLVVAPDVRASAQMVLAIGTPMPVEGGSATQLIDLTPSDPAQPLPSGPNTLVARCYSESSTPSASNFFLPGDQHVALRNLFVVATSSTQVAFKFKTLSLVPQLTPVKKVKLKAVLDLSPDPFVKNAIAARMQSVPGLLRLRTEPLVGGFRFDLTGFPASNVVDPSTPPPVISPFPTNPFFEAAVELPSRQVVDLTFAASLKKVAAGEGCIFHFTQHSLANESQGGLTLLVLKQ
jgi:hypothetical protein